MQTKKVHLWFRYKSWCMTKQVWEEMKTAEKNWRIHIDKNGGKKKFEQKGTTTEQ